VFNQAVRAINITADGRTWLTGTPLIVVKGHTTTCRACTAAEMDKIVAKVRGG